MPTLSVARFLEHVCLPTAGRVFWLALLGNFAWELTQTPCYSTLPEWLPAKIAICVLATAADAGYAALVYCIGASLCRDRYWIGRLSLNRILAAAFAGLTTAVAVEFAAQRWDIWHYSARMPMVPGLGVGLLPTLQLALISLAVLGWVGSGMRDQDAAAAERACGNRLAENSTPAPVTKQTESALTAAPRSA